MAAYRSWWGRFPATRRWGLSCHDHHIPGTGPGVNGRSQATPSHATGKGNAQSAASHAVVPSPSDARSLSLPAQALHPFSHLAASSSGEMPACFSRQQTASPFAAACASMLAISLPEWPL